MVQIICPVCQKNHPEDVFNCPNSTRDNQLTIFDFTFEILREEWGGLDSSLKLELYELLQCPVKWETIFPDCAIATYLENFWIEVAGKCLDNMANQYTDPAGDVVAEFDLDYIYESLDDALNKIVIKSFSSYFQPYELTSADEDELSREMPYIRKWIKNARNEYSEKIRRFEKIRMLTTNEQMKHFDIANLSEDAIREKTNKGKKVSLFYRGITPTQLETLLWSGLEETWRLLLDVPYENLYIDTMKIIGASKGEDTTYICFKLDLNTPSAHAHPILKKDIPPGQKVDNLDKLQ